MPLQQIVYLKDSKVLHLQTLAAKWALGPQEAPQQLKPIPIGLIQEGHKIK